MQQGQHRTALPRWQQRAEITPMACCRGGLILYRTVVAGAALDGNAVLDVGEPVRDYAQVCALCFMRALDIGDALVLSALCTVVPSSPRQCLLGCHAPEGSEALLVRTYLQVFSGMGMCQRLWSVCIPAGAAGWQGGGQPGAQQPEEAAAAQRVRRWQRARSLHACSML